MVCGKLKKGSCSINKKKCNKKYEVKMRTFKNSCSIFKRGKPAKRKVVKKKTVKRKTVKRKATKKKAVKRKAVKKKATKKKPVKKKKSFFSLFA